jgi:hypothetical protein
MTDRAAGAARAGWALAAVTTAAVLLDSVVTVVSSPQLFSDTTVAKHGWPITPLASVGAAVVGALILAHYPRHVVGWLLCLFGAVTSVANVAEVYSVWVHRNGGPGNDLAWQLSGWLSVMFGGTLSLAGLGAVFLLAPDGRLLSRRWRPALAVLLLGQLLFMSAVASIPLRLAVVDVDVTYGQPTEALSQAGLLLVTAGLVAAAASMVVRMRRAHGEVRLQLRWVATAAILLVLGVLSLIVVEAGNGGRQTAAASLPLFLSLLAFPLLVGTSVLRHRLFDIELVVSRAALVAVATLTVAAGYVVVVVLVAGTASGGSVWSSLLATVVVALAFQALRARAVRLAHRLAYGRRAAPYEALADLGRRLGESADPEQLLPAAAETAAVAVAASSATVTLTVPDASDITATWPAGAAGAAGAAEAARAVVLPVVDQGEHLGDLAVVLPPGRSLRPADRALLARLGDQIALALRNARLAAELAARVAQLAVRSGELAGSRARLIAARDAERDRLEARLRRDVVGHLSPLPERLRLLAEPGISRLRRQDELGRLAEHTTAALDALRRISHGIYPAQLERLGLATVLARQAGGPATLDVDDSLRDQRFDGRVESAAYYCVTETLRALGPRAHAWLGLAGDDLVLRVTGSETGSETGTATGTAHWAQVRDRAECLGGGLTRTAVDDRSVVDVRIPARQPVGAGRP